MGREGRVTAVTRVRLGERGGAARAALRRAARHASGALQMRKARCSGASSALARSRSAGAAVGAVVRHGARRLGRLVIFGVVCVLALIGRGPRSRRTPRSSAASINGHGTPDRVLALTFDDGPSSEWTPRVLDALRDARRAGDVLRARPARRGAPRAGAPDQREGHQIASHGYDHSLLTFATPAEVSGSSSARSGRWPRRRQAVAPALFRAPHGFRNPFVRARGGAARLRGRRLDEGCLGYRQAGRRGDRAAHDAGFRPGAILLLHDADGSGARRRSQPDRRGRARDRRAAHAAGYRVRDRVRARRRGRPRGAPRLAHIAVLVLFGMPGRARRCARSTSARSSGSTSRGGGSSRRSGSTSRRSCSRRSSGRRRSTRCRITPLPVRATSCRRCSSASCSTRCCPRGWARSGASPCCGAG